MLQVIKNEIERCCDCNNNYDISLLKPKVFYGKNHPKVMIIGHSPTVRTSEKAETVLKMDKPNGQLYKYISTEVLQPLSINIEDIYCTNLIKCYTGNLPEDNNKKDKQYISRIFYNCYKLLEKEISIIKPKLIISLSGRVYEILSEKYIGNKLKIQDNFGKLHTLSIAGMNIQYVPVIHLPKYKKIKEYYFPDQRIRLDSIRKDLDIFLND